MDDCLMIDPRPPGGLRTVLEVVAFAYRMEPNTLLSPSREWRFAHPRQHFMYEARQIKWADGRYRYSLPQIGRFLGIDHTTVLFGVRQHEKRMAAERNRPPIIQHSLWTIKRETMREHANAGSIAA